MTMTGQSFRSWLTRLALPGLAMSLGWGIRGDYGHEAGALLPGALLALACSLTAGRADWLARAACLGLLGALGWAIGGQMSYGMVIGYSGQATWREVLYGFAALFVIGALWGGIGAGVLALGLTWGRAQLESCVGPLSALYVVWLLLDFSGATEWLSGRWWSLYDSDWVAATTALLTAGVCAWAVERWRPACWLMAVLAGGWWLGFGLLTLGLGLRMTPPRSDNWAGCLGLCAAFGVYLWRQRNRAALLLMLYGALAGGLGFAIGAFVQILGRTQWGPIGRYPALQQLDYWKWMEQLFGLLMGLGVALGVQRLVRDNLRPVETEPFGKPLRYFSLLVLLVVMPWENLSRNVSAWTQQGQLGEGLFGGSPQLWFGLLAAALSATILIAIQRHLRGELRLVPVDAAGRASLLFLLLLWLFVVADFTRVVGQFKTKGLLFVHVSFWVTGILISLLVLFLRQEARALPAETAAPEDRGWKPGWLLSGAWLLAPLLILALAKLSLATHTEPLSGSKPRFSSTTATRP